MTLRCLFVAFNSYFASVGQCDEPRSPDRCGAGDGGHNLLHCCQHRSEAFGVKTGTAVWDAYERHPEIVAVEARPARYVEVHHLLVQAIGDYIPQNEEPDSIDEVACWLMGRDR